MGLNMQKRLNSSFNFLCYKLLQIDYLLITLLFDVHCIYESTMVYGTSVFLNVAMLHFSFLRARSALEFNNNNNNNTLLPKKPYQAKKKTDFAFFWCESHAEISYTAISRQWWVV